MIVVAQHQIFPAIKLYIYIYFRRTTCCCSRYLIYICTTVSKALEITVGYHLWMSQMAENHAQNTLIHR